MSDLDREVNSQTASFSFFDREWSVPTKQRLSHIRALRDGWRMGSNLDLLLAEVFLSDEQFAELCEIDPDMDDLDKFGDEISRAVGLTSSGNSAPSVTS